MFCFLQIVFSCLIVDVLVSLAGASKKVIVHLVLSKSSNSQCVTVFTFASHGPLENENYDFVCQEQRRK